MMNIRPQVCLSDVYRMLGKSAQRRSRYSKPSANEYSVTTTDASVGVKKPVVMPPMMMTGAINGQNASLKLIPISAKLARGSEGKPRGLAMSQMPNIMAKPMSTPGTAPAMKSWLTDTEVIAPYNTNGIDGGITGPMVEAPATMAAEMDGL
ncbi:hypothetical protein D3C71_1670390 [compost metagenome]